MECCDFIDSDFDVGLAARVVAFVLAHSSVEAKAGQILKIVEHADAACLAATGRTITGDRPVRQSAVLCATSNLDCLVNFEYVQASPEWESLVEPANGGRIRLRRVVDVSMLDLDDQACRFLLDSIAAEKGTAGGLGERLQRLRQIKDEIDALLHLAESEELDSLMTRLAAANREAARLIGEERLERPARDTGRLRPVKARSAAR